MNLFVNALLSLASSKADIAKDLLGTGVNVFDLVSGDFLSFSFFFPAPGPVKPRICGGGILLLLDMLSG